MSGRSALVVVLAATLAAAALVVAANAGGNRANDPSRVPVLVELFTSEGCSSCPPADDLLRRLVRDQPIDGVEVIAISEHVDYWNRLGWTDPFSSPRFSDRQREFARALGSQLYTPQLVVDGRLEAIGSDWPAVERAILDAAGRPRAAVTVAAERSSPDRVTVRVSVRDLPSRDAAGSPHLGVALVEDGLVTRVLRGENALRRLRHDAVARVLESAHPIEGPDPIAALTRELPLDPAWDVGHLRAVAFVQDERSRHILGAGAARVQQ